MIVVKRPNLICLPDRFASCRTDDSSIHRLLASKLGRPLFNKGIQAFLTILGGRNKRKTFRDVFNCAPIICIDSSQESVATNFSRQPDIFLPGDRGRISGAA
jgi:hypothetical protein